MGVARVYIKPFTSSGIFATDYIEVTKYVGQFGTISQDVDSLEYQLGIYRNSSFNLVLQNRTGKFSDIGVQQSIFRYKRSDSIIRITYQEDAEQPILGFARCGFIHVSNEVEVFKGILNDESLSMDARSEDVSFTCLGFESLFDRVNVPFASISNGDLISDVLYALLNQTLITTYLTVNLANINPSLDQAIDDVTDYQNKTAKDIIDNLLLKSNSVLYIKNDTVYVTSRAPSVAVMHTFYGQGSLLGPETISNLKSIRSGAAKQFNTFTWANSTNLQDDNNSVTKYGRKNKEISGIDFTNLTKRNNILSSLVSEFKDPKQEFEVETPMTYKMLTLGILDKVQFDYPTVYVPGDFLLPICGLAVCADPLTATLPLGLWAFKVDLTAYYKILKRSYNFKDLTASFKVRLI